MGDAQGLGDRLELIPYAPRRRSLELQRDSEALLLLIPDAGGRGKGVLSGKVFEYLAAERPILAVVPPDGAAAELIRARGRRRRRRARRRRRHGRRAARPARRVARQERSPARRSPTEWRTKVSRRTRVEELAAAPGAPRMRRVTSFLFLASVFCVTFEKVHWNIAGSVSLADVLALLFLAAFAVTTARLRVPRTTAVLLGFFAAFLARLPRRLLQPLGLGRARPVGEGPHQVADPLRLPRVRGRLALAARPALLLAHARLVQRRHRRQRGLRRAAAARRAARRQPRRERALTDHRRREPDQHLRRDQRRERLPAERADRRPEPPRDHADRARCSS